MKLHEIDEKNHIDLISATEHALRCKIYGGRFARIPKGAICPHLYISLFRAAAEKKLK